MFRAFNLSSKYGRSKAEKILLTYQTFAISVKVPTPYTTQQPCYNCVARLGAIALVEYFNNQSIERGVVVEWLERHDYGAESRRKVVSSLF